MSCESRRFDFSRFHPLDHWPGTRRCRQHYGGWRHHLVIAWDFRRRDQFYGLFARWTTCVVGRHRWKLWRLVRNPGPRIIPTEIGAPGDYTAMCAYCHRTRTATEDEWF